MPTAAAQGVPDIVLRTATIAKVESILGHSFQNRAVLAQAMTHRSIVNTGKENVPIAFEDKDGQLVNVSKNNERLELVGDKVFGLLVAQTLYDRAGEFTEGKMSIMSQSLVSRKKATSYCRYVFSNVGLRYISLSFDTQGVFIGLSPNLCLSPVEMCSVSHL